MHYTANLPVYCDVVGLRERGLRTALHTHQLQGLIWAIKAERRRVSQTVGMVRGLQRTCGARQWYNIVSQAREGPAEPKLPQGGIIADEMGLGKTLQSEYMFNCHSEQAR